METLIGLIVFGAILFLPEIITNYKFDNRVSPRGYKTDYESMNRDLGSGMSKYDVKRKFNSGGYDVPKNEFK